jgi:predicted permease
MSAFHGLLHRIRVLLRGESYAREQQRELEHHLELDAAAHHDESDDERQIAIRRAFGNVSYYREEMRAISALAWLDRLRQTVGYAARGVRRSPGFSLAVVITIGLGAGLNATMFSLLDRTLLRPPAGVDAPFALRRLYIDPGYSVTTHGSRVFGHFSYANYRAVADATPRAPALAYTPAESLAVNDGAFTIHLSYASSNYFTLLGVRPMAGRVFGADEAPVESPTPVMVISERLWRSAFGSDPNVLGRPLRVGELRSVVIGIVGAEFSGLDLSASDAWMPLNMFDGGVIRGPAWYSNGGGNFLTVVARPRDASAESELGGRGALAIRSLREAITHDPDRSTMLTGPIIEARGPAEQPTELTLSTRIAGVAVIVLLIACANVATLLVVRGTRRQREIAVRRALGASNTRLYEQVIVESLLLAALGGVVAIGLSIWGGAFLRTLLFPGVHWVGGTFDWRVGAFVGASVLVVGIVAGFVPAANAAQPDVMNSLRAGTTEAAHRRSLASSALLSLQAALCVVLLVGAGLFVRSFDNVRSIDIGFDTDGLVFGSLSTTPQHRWGAEAIPSLEQAAAALRRMPGVRSTALALPPPMGGYAVTRLYRVDGDSLSRIGRDFPAYTSVSPEYFQTTGVRLLRGRLFATSDGASAPLVMLVSRRMAQLVWPGRSPVGECLIVGKLGQPCTTVVGVVEDTHRMQIVASPAIQFYLPLTQVHGYGAPAIVARAERGRVAAVLKELQSQVLSNVPGAKYASSKSVDQLLDRELRPWRLGATLFSAFGILALCVAAIGIYSVVAYAMSQRTHEMGVRLALGASVRDIVNLVALDRMLVVALGVAVGIAFALLLGRYVGSLLFGVTPNDASVLIGAAALLIGVAIAASLLPAWRATRIDPATALRAE